MTRKLTITDYGKDYGFGRYAIQYDNVTTHTTNDYDEVVFLVSCFGDDAKDMDAEPQCT